MLDANFRLKLKDRGVDDVDLSPGWAYFVEQTKYWSHISKYGNQTEVRYCTLLVDYTNYKQSTFRRITVLLS